MGSVHKPVLICGSPGTGKTTLVQLLAERFGKSNCVGFFSQENRVKSKRTGFFWETFDGKRGNLADLSAGTPRVGKYRVDLESFESMLPGLTKISNDKILMIDEVGKMECLSEKFRALLSEWEKCKCKRIFTVPMYGTPFIEQFKTRNREHLIHLTRSNREELLEHLSA
jgi:nucleoside-triphosphatase